MLKFTVRTPGGPERTVEVSDSPALAGSGSDLPIVLEDPAAESRHFSLTVREEGVVLRDLGTEAGTRVNGSWVSQVLLRAGDEIRVGETVVVFLLQTAGAPAARAPKFVPAPRPTGEGRVPRRRRRSGIFVTVGLLVFAVGGTALAVWLMKDLLRETERSRGWSDTETATGTAAPAGEPAEKPPVAESPDLPPTYVAPPDPAEPGPADEPAPAAAPAGPAEIPGARSSPGDSDEARERAERDRRERERREAEQRERKAAEAILRFEEAVRDRIPEYAFAAALADLDAVLELAPEGPTRGRAEAWRTLLGHARDAHLAAKGILIAGDGREVEFSGGLTLTLTGGDEEGFTAKTGGAVLTFRWSQLKPADARAVVVPEARTAGTWLDLAAFGAVLELPVEVWEGDLLRAFRADENVKPEIDVLLALRRDVPVPPGGFVLFEGQWVTPEARDHLAEGHVLHEGRWLTRDEYMEAVGYVRHEGRWLSPEDYEEVLEARREAEALAAKYMPAGLIDEPGHGDSTPWEKPIELKTRHYEVRTNLGKEVARDIAYTMEILITNLKAEFGLRGRGKRFTVNVVANRAEYVANWPRAGRSLGFTSSGEIVTYYQPPSTTAVLMHEGTHQILHRFAPSCPRWLHEGMASYFECSRFRFDPERRRVELEVGLLNAMRLAGIQRQIRAGTAVSIEDFIRGAGGDPYQQGWAFVYYLAKGKDGRYARRLHEFVKEARGQDVVEKFQRIFRVRDMAVFEEEWKAFILALDPADGIRIDAPHR